MLLFALAGAVIGNTSCEHKPLYLQNDDPRQVRVIFNWDNLRQNDPKPTGMHLTFTDATNHGSEYDVPTATGLLTTLDPQDYIITGSSNNIPDITTTSTKGDVEIHALDPDADVSPIYGFSQTETVENNAYEEGSAPTEQVIVVTPHPLNCIYTIKILNTDVVPNGVDWTATLSGLTDAIMLSTGKSADNANEVTRSFTLDKQAAPTERHTTISVLGKLIGSANWLRLKVKRTNNSYIAYKADVTKQIDSAPDFRNVTITLDLSDQASYELDVYVNDGGLQPDVDNFTEVDEEIVI